MLSRTLSVAAVLAATVASAPVAAQTADQNVRCLLASNLFSRADKDPTKRQAASESVLFFMGRIDPRMPPAQLKALMLAQGKTLNQQNLGPTMNACIQQIAARQKAMQAISQDIARTLPKKP